MRGSFIYILFGFVLMSSCKTEMPIDDSSQAVFFIRGEINGKRINLNAGDDNYFMLPNYEDDTLNIRAYSGRIGLYKCVGDIDCPQSVDISFRENAKENGLRPTIEKTIYPRVCDLRGPASFLFESFKASFFSKSDPSAMTHTWYFGDGSSSNEINPVHYYLNASDSIVSPVLIVDNLTNSCTNSISYEINFESPCSVDFHPMYVTSQITLNPYPTNGRNELWSYNGYPYDEFVNIGPPTDSITTVCLQSTETATNCISYKCKNVVIDTAVVGCVANFDVITETVKIEDVLDYSEVTVTWQNETGKVYMSDRFTQPTGRNLEIIEVSDYNDSPEGDAVKMVTLKFDLRLFGESETDFVDFNSDKSVVALAYPK